MFLVHSAYCSRFLKRLGVEMLETASARTVYNVKGLFLELVSNVFEPRKGKGSHYRSLIWSLR